MILTYKPDGEERQVWSVKFGKLRSSEADLIEKFAGVRFVDFQKEATAGPGRSLRALTFVMLKRAHPAMRWEDFDPLLDEIELDFDKDEMEQVRAEISKDPTLTAEQVAMLDAAVEAAEEAPPKAPASSDA